MSREQLALRAAEILDNPVFNQVFERLDAKAVAEWRFAVSPEQREQCHMRQKLLREIREEMLGPIKTLALLEKQDRKPGGFCALLDKFTRKNKPQGDLWKI